MFEVICISFAFAFGLTMRRLGLPPLVGFLAAGFAVNAFGPALGMPENTGSILKYVAHLGVLLLLFTVGLKLRLSQMAQPQVGGGAIGHFLITSAVFTIGLISLAGVGWNTALLVAFALSFSSTVFSAKTLEAKRDIGAFYGRTAIGILIVQDIIAMIILAIWGGKSPTIWALWVLVLPLLRPLLHRVLDLVGEDEMLVLLGMLLALVIGGMGFEAVGLSSEIGALVMGLMLSTHKHAKRLSNALWSLKEVFLVGFFLQIGMNGLPQLADLVFAAVMVAILPLKGVLFFFLLIAFKLRARSAFMAAASLTAYSEFGLIVAAGVLPEWLVPLALAVALSLMIAAPLNRWAQAIFERFEDRIERFQLAAVHRDELPTNLGDARFFVLGMGRTGTAAYQQLVTNGEAVIAVDADTYKVAAHKEAGRNVAFADVEDAGFWRKLDLSKVEAVILAMDNIEAKEYAANALRHSAFAGPIVSHVLSDTDLDRLRNAGATQIYLTLENAGMSLADQASEALTPSTA
jgi:predicted Kef-type K+ transport protein